MTPEPPQLPGFRQLAPLRRGRSVAVYRARQHHPDRWVAISIFDVRLTERAAVEQFRAEARAIGKLAHPGILPVHGADLLPDARPYLVTELCEGSLADRISARGRLDPHEVTAVGLVVGRALLHAHEAGVRHGDLTPEGVLLRDGALPVLAGFELAVLCDYRDVGEPTPAHAAPETVRADGAVDERTDVYGLGSILFTALAGAAPFPTRRGEQEQDRLARILLDEPPPPPGPAWLADLVRAMLAKDPAARPTLHRVVDMLAADADATDATDTTDATESLVHHHRPHRGVAAQHPQRLRGDRAADVEAGGAGPVLQVVQPDQHGQVRTAAAALPGEAADALPAVPTTRPEAGRHPSPWTLTAACLAVLVVAVVAGVLLVWPAVG